ncbi:bis(5'-nucleosyl)-tetraphosphatase (symmetrical) YqeK [Candidatus Margulisiibacteriota bacterium]
MYKAIEFKLQQNISPKRFAHSKRVAETAEHLAAKCGADPNKAYLSGLLHDCARDLSEKELTEHVAKNKLKVKKYELQYPVLLHGEVGADLAQQVYEIEDEEIQNAIRQHTAGGRDLAPLSKVLYVADFIEPGRSGDIVKVISAIAEKNLERAVLQKAQFMLEFSKRVREKLHPDVLATLEFYKNA